MITTAVHQASQLIEIQGAPAAPASGDDFRAAFAASAGGAAEQKTAQNSGQTLGGTAAASSGAGSGKHVLVAGLAVKTSPLAASGTVQRLVKKAAGPDESSGETALDTMVETRARGLNASPNLALKGAAAADAEAETADGVAGTARESATQAIEAAPVKSADLGLVKEPAGAGEVSASIQGAKEAQAAKPSGAVAARGRKDEAMEKEAGAATASAIAGALAGPTGASLTNLAQAVPHSQIDTTALAEEGTKPAVLTSMLQASGDVNPAGGVAAGIGESGAAVSAAAGLKESASLPPAGSNSTGSYGGFATLAAAGSEAPVTKGSLSGQIAAEAQLAGSDADSARTRSLTGAGAGPAAASAAVDAELKPVAGSTQTKSIAAVNSGERKASTSVAAMQARPIAQPLVSSRPALAKSAGATTGETEAGRAENPSGSGVPVGAIEAGASGQEITAHGEVKLAQPPDALNGSPANAATLPEASLRTAIAAASDERPKNAAASDETSSAVPASAQIQFGDAANGTNSAAAAGNAVARAVPIADAALPFAAATGGVAAASSHGIGTGIGSGGSPAVSARALGAVSAGQLAEPSAVAQAGEPHRTLLATPTTLEVGVQSGAQGWLRIRAEVGGQGEVNASLSAASSGGRDLLHSQLPALNAFLHSEQLAVTATVAERGSLVAGGGFGGAASGSGGLGTGLGTGLGSDASGGSNASLLQGGGAQSGSRNEAAQQTANGIASDVVNRYDATSGVRESAGLPGSPAVSGESGRWLNVRV